MGRVGGGLEAELDARLGTTDWATVGNVAVGAVGGHGYGALSRVMGGSVDGSGATSDRGKCRTDGWFAVHKSRRGLVGILCGRHRGGNHNGGL